MQSWLLALSTTLIMLGSVGGSRLAEAQSFYEGKTVRVIVGLAPGGGFDTYARVIARHMGRHIPGNPTVVVENMPGAGSLISANHIYRVAKPDGLTVAKFNGSLMLGQVMGQAGVEFDARKFEFIGAAVKEDVACALTKASGITSMEKWMAATAPVKLGGVAPGASPDNSARVLKAALGLPIQLVSGYRGTAEIRLAADGGEVSGACWSWESMRATWRNALQAGDAVAVLQVTARSFPDLQGVPLANQPGQDRRGPTADPGGCPEQQRLRSPLRAAAGHPEGAGPGPAPCFPGDAEGRRVSRGGGEGQAHARPGHRRGTGENGRRGSSRSTPPSWPS